MSIYDAMVVAISKSGDDGVWNDSSSGNCGLQPNLTELLSLDTFSIVAL